MVLIPSDRGTRFTENAVKLFPPAPRCRRLALVLCERLRATTRGWAAAASAIRPHLEETP